jgi:YidC/Oxa1 family membrane protein insertase
MADLWNQGVDILKESMLAYAFLFNGNLGAGIVAVTFLARLALMPITLRLARLSSAHQTMLRKLQPELDQLKNRYANDPRRLNEEMQKVFGREGISPVPVAGCLGAVAQAPALIALYSAVRRVAMFGGQFGWILDISKPDAILTVLVALIGAAGMFVQPSPSAENRNLMMLLSTAVTLIVLSKMSAGVALYWGMSNAVGAVQGFVGRSNRGH